MSDDEPASNGNGNGAGSHLDWLRARHAALSEDRTLDLEVPGYEGRLVVRYGPAPWKSSERLQQAMVARLGNGRRDDARALLNAQADVLIAACRDVQFRNDDGELQPLDPTGEPITFGPELAQLVGADGVESARDVLFWIFGPTGEFGVTVQAGEVLAWTQDATRTANAEFVGE